VEIPNIPEDAFSFVRSLANPLFADVCFLISTPPQKIYSHACIIEARCSALLKNAKKKKNVNEVEVISSINASTFQELLNYLYSGSIDLSKLKDEDILLLLSASTKYEGLDRLSFICQRHLKKTLDMKNVHLLLKTCEDLDLKAFKEFVVHFAVSHYNEFVSNKQGVKDIGINIFQEVVALQQEQLKPLPEEKEPEDTFLENFKALYDSVKQSDISFVMTEPNSMGISGTFLRGHKAIIVARASGLQALVNQPLTEVSKSLSGVIVKGVSPEGFEAVLKWIYYNQTQISTLIACELISFCQQNSLFALQKVCIENIKNNIKVDTVLTILDVSYLKEGMPSWYIEEMDALRPKCIEFAANRVKEIEFDRIKTKKLSTEIATAVMVH